MKHSCILLFFLLESFLSIAQNDGYKFLNDVNSVKIPFEFIDNNIIIPLKLNNVDLNFILDSGATKTMLFDYQNVDSLTFRIDKRIKFSGYGELGKVEGFNSGGNSISIRHKLFDQNAELIVLLNNPINLSAIIDYPVNGLLGIDFFRNYLVELDFENQVLNLYKHGKKISRRIRSYKSLPIKLINNQ